MVEDILAEVAGDLLCPSETAHHLLGLVQAIIAAECLTLSLRILLEQQR